jgi:thiosulfate/3-mercaptopyruvate sulfurtransferase
VVITFVSGINIGPDTGTGHNIYLISGSFPTLIDARVGRLEHFGAVCAALAETQWWTVLFVALISIPYVVVFAMGLWNNDLMSAMPKGYANPELLISPRELNRRLGDAAPPTLVDLRQAEVFAQGHLPGAVNLDLFGISLIDTSPAPLDAFLWMIAHLLVIRGVSAERTVVVYDGQSGIRAARAFWFLELFGHPDPRLLDGGVSAWLRQGLTTTTETVSPRKGRWDVSRVDARLATWNDVATRLGRDDVVILDTRSDDEYYGSHVRAKRGGAIPGAVHIEWSQNLDGEGAFKAAVDLQALYTDSGVTDDLEVVSYCQGGYRAAHSYLALRLLGYPRVRNYIGSWKEWGDRKDLPIIQPQR